MPQAQTANVNCQMDTKMKDDLYALARNHERSASAEIRLAIRSHLKRHAISRPSGVARANRTGAME
jgi:hypothetical protein